MSNRLHLRLFLVVAACLLGAGTAGSLIQRAAANADFREYSQLTESRSALLEEAAALQSAIASCRSSRSPPKYAPSVRIDSAAAPPRS